LSLLASLVAGCDHRAPDPRLTDLQQEWLATMVPPGGKLELDAGDRFFGSKRLPLAGATSTVGRYRTGDAFRASVALEESDCPPRLCGG
jgi:hypothetical protein